MTKNRDISKILDQNTTFLATLSVGGGTANIFANSTILKLANSTVNTSLVVPTAAQYAGSYYLKADGTWALVSAGATPGGANTQVQFNDSTALGGTAGFTFDKATNNAIIANTLTVGSATINSTNYSQTSNNALNLGGLAAAGYANLSVANFTTSVNVGANVGLTTSQVKLVNSIANTTLIPGNINLSGSNGVIDVGPRPATASVSTDDGLWWSGSGRTPVGIFTEVTGNIASFGINCPQIGNRINSIHGGIFRFDIRAATEGFHVLGWATGGNVEANLLSISLQTGAARFLGGVFPVANTTGQAFGNTISRWNITGNSATFSSTLAATDTTITGFVNATIVVNSAAFTIGTTLVANTLGVHHTGTINAASFTTTGFRANTIGTYPTSNASGQLFGNTISRWTVLANTVTVSGGVSPDSNTLGQALGTATQRWVLLANTIESTGLANVNALNVVNQTNTATLFVTTSATVGANVLANTTAIVVGNSTVNVVVGNNIVDIGNTAGNLVANSIALKLSNTTVNTAIKIPTAAEYAGAYYLKADGSWATVTAGSALPAGANTHVQYNDSGATGGTAGFTFDEVTNNVFVANTLTVGSATINSTKYSQTANNADFLGGVAAASYALDTDLDAYQTEVGLPANVATLAANSATYLTGANAIANVTGLYVNGVARFTGPVSETATGTDRIDIGVQGSTPRMIFENDTGVVWEIDNDVASGNVFRWFTPSVLQMTLGLGSVLSLPNTTNARIGISTGTTNVVANTTMVRVANSTSSANHDAGSFVVGTTISNSTGVFVGTAVIANSIGLTTTGFVNATTVVNSAAFTIGTTLVANTLGVHHTSTMNAASFTTTGFRANTIGVYPTSNSSGQLFGNTISRWDIDANSVMVSTSVVPDSNTLGTALGTTTQRWVLTANSADIGPNFVANSLGAYHTATMNATSFTTTGFRANTIGVYPTSNSSGQLFGNTISRWAVFANTIDITTSITANGALGGAAQILTSNSLGGVYWAAPSGGGDVTKVGTPVDDQVGVWTGSGTIEGTAGFTFSAATNNATIANTLTVGTATVNSTLANVSALNVTNQINTATFVATTSAIVGNAVQNTTAFSVTGNTTTAPSLVLASNSSASILYGNTTVTGAPTITISNSISNAVVTSLDIKLGGTATVANTLGVYTGIVNAATHSVGTSFTANSTLVNAAALNVVNQINTATFFAATSANVGTAVIANSIGLTTTGFVNATTVVNSAAHTIGSTFIANTLGVYHTGIVNAASHTTTGFLANATHVVPTSNSSGQTFGNTISRWVITANSVTVSGGVSPDSNTLGTALGTTTQRWVALANTVTVSGGVSPDSNTLGTALGTNTQRWILTANSADIGPNFVANSLGAYHTAAINAASFTTTGFRANTIGVYPTSNSSGQLFGNTISRWAIFANTIDITTSITANGALGGASQVLTSNSLGGVYWTTPSGGGNVNKVGTPVDDQVGVWTGDGTIEGTAGFTFSAATNNATIANTLTIGSSVINTTSYKAGANVLLNTVALAIGNTTVNAVSNDIILSIANSTTSSTIDMASLKIGNSTVNVTINSTTFTGTANNANFLGGTAAASYQLNSTLAANVATMTANNATWHGTSVFANSTGAYPTSNSVGAILGNTISRVIITGNSGTFSSTLAATDTTITGFVNATVVVNSAAHTVGTSFIANTLGVYHTGIVNAASHTTTGFLANATHVVPTSNSSGQTFGNTISRWVITANSLTVSGGASPDSNTLGTALGTATQRWVLLANTIESTGLANVSALNVVNQTNTATLYATTSANVGANVQVTTSMVSVSNGGATNVQITATGVTIANSTNTTTIVPPSTAQKAGAFYLKADGTWATTTAAPGGSDTQVQFNDAGATNGSAGFIFTKSTNNVTIANTLTVGTATINSTNYSQTANNALNLGGTAAAGYQTTAGLAANVATLSSNNATWHGTSVFANSTGAYPTSNSVGAVLGNTISRAIITANSVVTSGGVSPDSNTVGTALGTTTQRWVALANTVTVSGGVSPDSNTLGTALGSTTQRWVITGNSATFSSTLAATDTTITGFVNATVVVNSAAFTIGSTFIANTLGVYHTGLMNAASYNATGYVANTTGVYHTGTMNAASFTTTGFRANTIGVYPTSNSSGQLFGNTISRWDIDANSVMVSTSVVPDSNTVGTALGTTTQRWVLLANTIESTGLANVSALNVVNQTNTATLFATTSATVGANVIANTTSITVGNSTSNVLVGNNLVDIGNSTVNLVASQTQLKLSNSTVNTGIVVPTAAEYAGAYYLHANGTWQTAGGGGIATKNYQLFTATASQTDFVLTNTFANSLVDVYYNGVHLANTEFTPNSASNTVVLAVPAILGAAVEVSAFSNATISSFTAAPGGANTTVQYNDSSILGGSLGFTFNKTTNNVLIANTLTVGSATVNSTFFSKTANDALTANNSLYLGGIIASSFLRNDLADQTITGGARVTVNNLGNLSGQTITPDPGDRPMQKITNNGAGTILPGSNYGNYLLDIINTTGAGAITTTGWTVKGDSFDATTTSKFRCAASVTADIALLTVTKVV